MKTKGQDVETLILKEIFICLELWATSKVLIRIDNSYRILKIYVQELVLHQR